MARARKNINYKQKISQKWGEKPHFRLIFGRDDRSRTCLNLLPKQAGNRYPTSRYSIFAVKSVSGQICGQKFFAGYEGGGKARKREKNGDFASFRRSAYESVTRSQSKRVTVTLHPENQKNCFRHNIIAEAMLFVNNQIAEPFNFLAVTILSTAVIYAPRRSDVLYFSAQFQTVLNAGTIVVSRRAFTSSSLQ